MRSFTIRENDAGQRMDKFITKAVPLLPKSLMYKYLRLKRIKLNGKRCEISTRLTAGDVVEMYIGDEFFDTAPEESFRFAGPMVPIVYEDAHLMVLNKPAGMTAHASNFLPDTPTVAGALAWQRGADFIFHVVNRLDKGTTGLMVVAKSGYVHDRLRRTLHSDGFCREYRAICIGCPAPPSGTIDAPIGRDETSAIRRVVRPDGQYAVSHYEVLSSRNGLSFVKLLPETGRTHQLRVHMASIGHPLAGDWLYGTEDPGLILRPALHSYMLTMTHPVTGELLHFTAPIPADMQALI